MRVFLFVIIILLAAGIGLRYGYLHVPQWAIPSQPVSGCGLTVEEPLANSSVTYQLEVEGTIDTPPQPGACTWTMFEGQGGQAKVVDTSGAVLAEAPINVDDWTATTTPFNAELDLLAASSTLSLVEGSNLTIELTPENPSGLPQTTQIDVPVVLRQ